MKQFKFYKENGNWYIDLPEWEGSKEDLLMVAGADQMLEIISKGKDQVLMNLSEKEFEFANTLKFRKLATDIENGAYYYLEYYDGEKIDLDMWLCDVTKFVFGGFPELIYLKTED